MSDITSTLIIRHLPSTLSKEEKEDLLRHFGASNVRCMRDTGKMRHTAFGTFPSRADAEFALSRLHQLEVLGHCLVAEFAKPYQEKHFPHEADFKKIDNKPSTTVDVELTEKEEIQEKLEELSKKLNAVAPKFGLNYLWSPLLKYEYPQPTHSIITNIAHTMAAVPKFYNQVLHLMNKMNLPAPFGPVTAAPPLYQDPLLGECLIQQDEMEVTTSEEESEIESDEDGRRETPLIAKRPVKSVKKRPRKKPKLQQLMTPITPSVRETATAPSDVFEMSSTEIGAKKILFNIKQAGDTEEVVQRPDVSEEPEPMLPTMQVEEGGFGTMAPQISSTDETMGETQDTETLLKTVSFISLSEIQRNRLSSRERNHASVFKNYSPGEATYRLYVKNLSKQVEEKDLLRIYGRYIDRNSETERNMFDIRLMKEGRMKGQAFVTLANEQQAAQALKDTNGYLLFGKPVVVQFARSARPKENK